MNFLDYVDGLPIQEAKSALKDKFAKNVDFFKKTNPNFAKYLQDKPSLFGLVFDGGGANVLNLATNTLV